MKDKELWAAFEKTGKITDYLQYKALDYFNSDKKEVGEETVEADGNGDRHDTVRSTYRGI